MVNTLTTIEDAILDEIQRVFGKTLREAKSIGGGWTLDSLKRALQFAPGVYVAFQGGNNAKIASHLDARWTVYVVNKGTDDLNRRRGNARVIGAYDILSRLAPALNNLVIPDVGSMTLSGINNLFRDAMFDLGGTVYAIQLTVANLDMSYSLDPSTLTDFVFWHADHYEPDGITNNEQPIATDEVHA